MKVQLNTTFNELPVQNNQLHIKLANGDEYLLTEEKEGVLSINLHWSKGEHQISVIPADARNLHLLTPHTAKEGKHESLPD